MAIHPTSGEGTSCSSGIRFLSSTFTTFMSSGHFTVPDLSSYSWRAFLSEVTL